MSAALDLYRDGMTEHELDRVTDHLDYVIAGIEDCFDALNLETSLERLVSIGPLLSEWWDAIVDLYDPDCTGAFRGYIELETRRWFDLRRDYLLALARRHGLNVPVPDRDNGSVSYGYIAPAGHYEFLLTGRKRYA